MPSFAQVTQTAQAHFGQAYTGSFVSAVSHALAIEPAQRPQSTAAWSEEMQLQAPQDMARFDWRAALGPGVSLESVATQAMERVTVAQTTLPAPQPPTQVMARRDRTGKGTVRTEATARKAPRKPARRPSPLWRWLWGAVAVALIALLVLGIYNTAARRTSVPPTSEVDAPALLAPPAQANTEIAPVPQGSASQATGLGTAVGTATAVPALARVSATPPSVPRSAPGKAGKPVATTDGTTAKPATGQVTVTVPAAKSPELCADASVFSRTMCVYKECQKPEYAQLPQCIADRKRWEAQNKQN